MRRYRFFFLCNLVAALELAAQTAVDVPRAEEKQKQEQAVAKEQEKHAQATTTVEFSGEQAFKEKDLRSAVKEQLATVDRYGLTPARADDLAFFVEVFYRKHGYTKASVHYKIESRDRLRLEINEGPLMDLGTITLREIPLSPRRSCSNLRSAQPGNAIQSCSGVFHSSRPIFRKARSWCTACMSRKVSSTPLSINRATRFTMKQTGST